MHALVIFKALAVDGHVCAAYECQTCGPVSSVLTTPASSTVCGVCCVHVSTAFCVCVYVCVCCVCVCVCVYVCVCCVCVCVCVCMCVCVVCVCVCVCVCVVCMCYVHLFLSAIVPGCRCFNDDSGLDTGAGERRYFSAPMTFEDVNGANKILVGAM